MNENKIVCEERSDEGIRTFKNNICGTLRTIDACGDKRVIEPVLVMDYRYDEGCRVRKDGTSPALNASKTSSTSPSGQTLLVEPMIVASRGRNPENPSDRTPGNYVEQRLEPNSEGLCNTLTSVQKDNLVLEPSILTPKRNEYGKAIRKDYENGKIQESRHNMTELQPREDGISNTLTTVQKDNLVIEPKKIGQISSDGSQCGTVYSEDGLSPTLTAGTHGYANSHIQQQYRIRKLTPLECAKLMKFTEEDANKMLEVNSNTQVYKQCGNAICVNVLEAIFCQMNIKNCPTWEERAKEEYL